MNDSETLSYMNRTECSVGRYGDGELFLMCLLSISFQHRSLKLCRELIHIAKNGDPSFLVCIPIIINYDDNLVPEAKKWWKKHLRRTGLVWRLFFSSGLPYGDTQITRPWIGIQDAEHAKKCFDGIRSIWDDKNIVMIEGEKSRVGVGNDFLDNARSVERILGPVRDAYSRIDEIYEKAISFSKDHLFLLALGPTATVLAYRLHKAGFRAIDIGHMDIEYEWFKMRATEKVPILNKYVNEAGGECSLVENDSLTANYQKQIKFIVK